jgi:hypothetical protein
VALKILLVDDATGKKKRNPGALWVDEDFDVVAATQTQFSLASSITATTVIDVYVNGRKRREGAGNSWARNVSPARIDFNEAIPQNAWVQVRVWSI